MRIIDFARRMVLCLCVGGLAVPVAGTLWASTDTSRMLAYLNDATTEDAADYLAFLIRTFGCEVRVEERRAFNAAVVDHLAFDFGVTGIETGADGERLLPEELRESLFAFSFRAGPHLVESGELIIDREGNAHLQTCNALIS